MTPPSEEVFVKTSIEAAIRIGLLLVIVLWSFSIMAPFVNPVLWGVIIAVAAHPLVCKLEVGLAGRRGLAATLFTLALLALFIIPTAMFSGSFIEGTRALTKGVQEGTILIPAPPENIQTWPVIGGTLYEWWSMAATNLAATAKLISPQIKQITKWLLSLVGSGISSSLQMLISLIISGFFLAKAANGEKAANAIAKRINEEHGAEFVDLSAAVIRSVVQGVIGVALIQTFLVAIGLFAIHFPAAGLWLIVVLIFSIVQLPSILVLGPIIAYVFSTSDTKTAVIFMIWTVFASLSDNFLKPLLMGRGVDIPMPVILIGAIGGMMSSGIIGLFVGAVVLALAYKLLMAWILPAPADAT